MKAKENWIAETLETLDGVQRVDVSFSVKEAIKSNFNQNKTTSITAVQKWTIAASIIVLLGVNLVSMVHYSKNQSTETAYSSDTKNVVYKEYFSSDY